jgi:hypothetical protein
VRVLNDKGMVLTFGWNSTGMGRKLGFDIEETSLGLPRQRPQRHDLRSRA